LALILLRHTRPVGSDGVCYGRSDLVPGPDLVREARRLDGQLPAVERIVSSPLSRCAKLAGALGAARGLAVDFDRRLAELDFGAWERRRWNDIPRDEIDAWVADLFGARPHGGETVGELYARVGEALAAIGALPGQTLVVTHMGPIRAALARADQPGAWEARLPFGGWTAV
jgi:alpha-ribazole phosphatase